MAATTTKHSGHQHPRPRSAAVVDDIVGRLTGLGYRDTEPRRLVISAVAAQGRPFTAEELCASLPCVGRATVYRGLRLFGGNRPGVPGAVGRSRTALSAQPTGAPSSRAVRGMRSVGGPGEMRRGGDSPGSRCGRGLPNERPLAGSVRPMRRMRRGLIAGAFYFCAFY